MYDSKLQRWISNIEDKEDEIHFGLLHKSLGHCQLAKKKLLNIIRQLSSWTKNTKEKAKINWTSSSKKAFPQR